MANVDIEAPSATILRPRSPSRVGLDRALHDAPFAHAVLVDAAVVVDRVERAIEDRIELDEVRGRDLRHPRRGHELDVEALVLEESLVAGDQHGQVVDRVHDRDLGLLRVAARIFTMLPPGIMAPSVSARFALLRNRALFAPRVAFTRRYCAAARPSGQSALISIPSIAGHRDGHTGKRRGAPCPCGTSYQSCRYSGLRNASSLSCG